MKSGRKHFSAMVVKETGFGTEAYRGMLALRKRILRDPLNLEWTEEEKSWEAKERHFGCSVEGRIVACLVIRSMGEGVVKLRQMAVDLDCQGAGWGRRLICGVEQVLAGENISIIELHARETALGFYEKLGFAREGEKFLEVKIPHWKMCKRII
ncbi:MAG TPA: GNAT family N-acetyltransferase [Verrucomicrobiales bacterium]|nr:GNAT family N-acetyltransferase [Verrucomicrobiales bacterium]